MTAQAEELAKLFTALSPKGKAAVLARISHMETIHVRAAQHDDGAGINAMVKSNELIHRLSGYIVKVLSQAVEEEQDRAFIEMILEASLPIRPQAINELSSWIKEARFL